MIGRTWVRSVNRSRTAPFAAALVLLPGFFAGLAHGQEPEADPMAELKKDVEALKKGQADIQRQLLEIRRLLQARPQAAAPRPSGPNVQGVVFKVGDSPAKGESTAPLTLVEFTDYQ